METGEKRIGENLGEVRERIRRACERSGRRPEEVTLIAVSKTKPFEDIAAAWKAGAAQFGENYVQEMTRKMDLADAGEMAGKIRWHMIGHLQKNKEKYLMGRTALIHSVDSVSLAEQIEREAARRDWTARLLLEVNIAGEETKWGFDAGGGRGNAEDAPCSGAGADDLRSCHGRSGNQPPVVSAAACPGPGDGRKGAAVPDGPGVSGAGALYGNDRGF